jgi:hypothetical protein
MIPKTYIIGAVFFILGIFFGGIAVYVQLTTLPEDIPGGIACTMDAKICPDGTGVGRTGPNCEFAPCP